MSQNNTISLKINNYTNPVNKTPYILPKLLQTYPSVMILKIFVDPEHLELRNMYECAADKHNDKLYNDPFHIDAGFDLFAPPTAPHDHDLNFFASAANKLDFKIRASAKMHTNIASAYNTGYYIHPRSSISKTPLRLANSTGIVDAGYRGSLIGMFDVLYDPEYFTGRAYDRYAQICAPSLAPIIVEIVSNIEDLEMNTERGEGGLGSTGR
jgi:dUTP pyrophosphatase